MAVNSPSPIKAYIYESACLAKSTQSVEKVWGGGGGYAFNIQYVNWLTSPENFVKTQLQ